MSTARGFSTAELMRLALQMADLEEVPGDSAVYVEGEGIRRILAGIDIGPAELLLAKQLGVDAALAHHPAAGLLSFPQVLEKHVDLMVDAGVPLDAARAAVAELREGIALGLHRANYDHTPSVARALGLPFLNIHNPLDELGRRRMARAVNARVGRGGTVREVVDALLELPEFAASPVRPEVMLGDPDAPAGRVLVAHGAGTNGGYPVARACFAHGVDTLVYIHLDHQALLRLRAEGRGNLVVAGHLPADLAGINPYLDELESRGLEIVRISGL